MTFGRKGSADITGILPDGRRLEIEVKSKIGRLSKHQKAFRQMILDSEGFYMIARSVWDVFDAFRPRYTAEKPRGKRE